MTRMRNRMLVVISALTVAGCETAVRAQVYPNASLDQATIETIRSLKIERYAGLDEEGVQAEYEWALDMAKLCLQYWEDVLDANEGVYIAAPSEFQRHAARTARYRGFLEQALDDSETAIVYADEHARLLGEAEYEGRARNWETTVLRDIADTFNMMGADQPAADITNLLLARASQRKADPVSGGELNRLAQIAQRTHRFAESVLLQRRAVNSAEQFAIPDYMNHYPELGLIDPSRAWSETVRQPNVRGVLEKTNPALNDLREAYYRLARALRLNGQLDEAGDAIETARLTPWQMVGTYRENLDLHVDREWAFLALDRGNADEAVRLGNECLSKYAASIHPGERVELLELISRGLEQRGDLTGAFDRLVEAIDIVEQRRANLALDEHKQLYIGQYADLYRRACELVIRIGEARGGEPSPHSRRAGNGAPSDPSPTLRFAKNGAPGRRFDRRTIEDSFRWAERAKARAMLDSMRRLGRRMSDASKNGDTKEIIHTRELAGSIVDIDRLQKANWWPPSAALIEYMMTPRGALVWIVTKDSADLVRLTMPTGEIERHAAALKKSLLPTSPRDQSWVAPAAALHDGLIRPIASHIKRATHLVIVGDGVLREIPFETFVAARHGLPKREHLDHRLLIDDYVIRYAPSATVLEHTAVSHDRPNWTLDYWGIASTRFHTPDEVVASLPKRREPTPRAQPNDPIGMVLRSARSLDLVSLPGAGREVTRAGGKFPQDRRRVFIDYLKGNQSAKDALVSASRSGELAGVRHLHFATHAILDSDRPFDSGLVLSPPYVDATAIPRDPSDPITRASRFRWDRRARHASILSLHDIAALHLTCELVILSSCQALGASPVDGDWLNGLTRAFFVAGADSVICTLWDVADSSAGAIVPVVYSAMHHPYPPSTGSPAEALRAAKSAMLSSPKHAHPSNWSGFVCYGGSGVTGR